MRNIAKILISAAFLAGAGSALAAAPAKTAPKAASSSAPTPAPAGGDAQVQDAMLYLKVLISGLQSDKVEQPIKGALVGCLYNNSLGKITDSMDKVIAENPGKINKSDPSELLSVMARICGYQPAGAPSATPPKNAPAGR